MKRLSVVAGIGALLGVALALTGCSSGVQEHSDAERGESLAFVSNGYGAIELFETLVRPRGRLRDRRRRREGRRLVRLGARRAGRRVIPPEFQAVIDA